MDLHVLPDFFQKSVINMGIWLYNKAHVNIKKWKRHKPFKIKLYSSESCIVLNGWIFILLIRWHAGESYNYPYYFMFLYFILLYCILLSPLCWCCIIAILLIVFCSIYGYVTLDVSSHMFSWLEGIEMNIRCPLLIRTAYSSAK
jgi:hypothetical protein